MKTMKKGFTLVELMVVIVIIGILAALAIPRFLGATNKAKVSEFKPVLKQIYTLQQAYRQERDSYNGTAADIGFEAPQGNNGRLPYFSYSLTATTDVFTSTATLRTAVGAAAVNDIATQSVNSAGVATMGGSAALTSLANWN